MSGTGKSANFTRVKNIEGDATIGNVNLTGTSGNIVKVNSDGELSVSLDGKVDVNNSTAIALATSATYTGTMTDISECAVILLGIKSDIGSATDGLVVEFSSDGTNWDISDEYTIPAASGKTFSFQPAQQYYRVRYTNGATAQNYFRLQTLLKRTYVKSSSHRVQDSIIGNDDAELTKSVLTAKDPNGTFVNIQATDSDNLRVTDAESGLAIAKGDVEKTTFIHKFGNAPDFDTGDNSVTIWDGADDANINQMIYQYSSTDDIDSISSSDNTDTQDIEIQGLDVNFDLVTQTITLTGQTRKALDTDLIRIFRMKNVNSTDNGGHIYCYVNSSITAGVPDDPTQVRAIIQPALNQTLMAVYTIPNGKTGYMRDWYASIAGANRTSNYIINILARPIGEVFQLKHRSSISDNGTSYIQHKYEEPEIFLAKTDIEIQTQITAIGVTSASISGGFDIVLVDD